MGNGVLPAMLCCCGALEHLRCLHVLVQAAAVVLWWASPRTHMRLLTRLNALLQW